MRIQAPNKITKVGSAAAKKRAPAQPGFADAIAVPQDSAPAQQARQMAPVSGLDSLLAAQSVDPDAERRASVQNASDVLDALEQLRRGILLGAISVSRLQSVSKSLVGRLEVTTDPRLKDIMTDIVLRARVELAKAGIYS